METGKASDSGDAWEEVVLMWLRSQFNSHAQRHSGLAKRLAAQIVEAEANGEPTEELRAKHAHEVAERRRWIDNLLDLRREGDDWPQYDVEAL